MIGQKVKEFFQIEYPILQAGFSGIDAKSVLPVCEEGGLGVLGVGLKSPEWLRGQLEEIQKNTQKPFGVEIFVHHPKIGEIFKVLLEKRVKFVFTDGGNPLPLFPYFESANIEVIPVVPTIRLAKKMEENGAKIVVLKGRESGAFTGIFPVFPMISLAKKILKIPLIVRGGIYDKMTAKVAFLLGADGIQIGTRLITTFESSFPQAYKQKIISAQSDDVKIILDFTNYPLSVIKNEFSERMEKLKEKNAFPEEVNFEKIFGEINLENVEEIPVFGGISAIAINELKSTKEVFKEIFEEATKDLEK
jgi:enoyl-[acyl-carrier protein] reductase II